MFAGKTQYKQDFAQRLQSVLEEMEINETMLACLAEIPLATVHNYISGHTMPNAYNVMRIAKALCVDANELLGVMR